MCGKFIGVRRLDLRNARLVQLPHTVSIRRQVRLADMVSIRGQQVQLVDRALTQVQLVLDTDEMVLGT